MLFAQRTKGYFVELNEHAIMVARTSAPIAPFIIEEMAECPLNDSAALEALLTKIQPKKSPTGYVHATVGIFPQKRLVRRHTLELKHIRESGYIGEICSQ